MTWDGTLDSACQRLGRVDPDGAPGYAVLRRRADRMDLDDLTVAVASIEDLIAMKRAAGRPQDLVDLESLKLARRRRR